MKKKSRILSFILTIALAVSMAMGSVTPALAATTDGSARTEAEADAQEAAQPEDQEAVVPEEQETTEAEDAVIAETEDAAVQDEDAATVEAEAQEQAPAESGDAEAAVEAEAQAPAGTEDAAVQAEDAATVETEAQVSAAPGDALRLVNTNKSSLNYGFNNEKQVRHMKVTLCTEKMSEKTQLDDTSGYPVYFYTEQNDAEITVSYRNYSEDFPLISYTDETSGESGYATYLEPGDYTYTASAEGYYASTLAFSVDEEGRVSTSVSSSTLSDCGLGNLFDPDTSSFHIDPEHFNQSPNDRAWNGTTLDVSWFDPDATGFEISNPEQFAGMAAIVNGIYDAEITTIIDDCDKDGTPESYSPKQYAALDNAKIVLGCSTGISRENNKVTSDTYFYNRKGYDFDGCTVNLTADLDMGGYQDNDGNWTGAHYMPIGGQYLMYRVSEKLQDGYSQLGSSFNGTLDGQGHTVYNIYCEYDAPEGYYGSATSVGLIGRLGIHDSDYSSWKKKGDDGGNYPAVNPTVKNVAVDGYISGSSSVGGIVGKVGQTSASVLGDNTTGGIIENCLNFATVSGTESKGTGGIAGSGWNSGITRNCANFGTVTNYRGMSGCMAGGIVGSNEHDLINCYNIGYVSNTISPDQGQGIGGSDVYGVSIDNCYWLTKSASGDLGYSTEGGREYNGYADVTEITDNYNNTEGSAQDYMKSTDFLADINGDGCNWVQVGTENLLSTYLSTKGISGYAVPRIFSTEEDTATVINIKKVSNVKKTSYIEGQYFDPSGVVFEVTWYDGADEKVETLDRSCDYSVNISRELETTDQTVSPGRMGMVRILSPQRMNWIGAQSR